MSKTDAGITSVGAYIINRLVRTC